MSVEREAPPLQPKSPENDGKSKKPLPLTLSTLRDIFVELAYEELDPKTREIFTAEPEKSSLGQKIRNRVNEIKGKRLSIGEKIRKPFNDIGVGAIMRRIDSKLISPIEPEFPKGFEEALIEKMKNPNAVLIIISNHFDHANLLEMMVMSKKLIDMINTNRNRDSCLKGTRLIAAKSLKRGWQDMFLQSALKRAEQNLFPNYYLSLEECISKNDHKRRHMNPSENLTFIKHLINFAQTKNEALEIFVEGSVDGGRFTNGKRNGMQPLIEELDMIFKIITKNEAEMVFVSFGTWGKNRVHTDAKRPTSIALKTLFLDKDPKSLVNIKVGMPITDSEIKDQIQKQKGQEATPEDIRNYLGITIASMLPPDFQGVFRKE